MNPLDYDSLNNHFEPKNNPKNLLILNDSELNPLGIKRPLAYNCQAVLCAFNSEVTLWSRNNLCDRLRWLNFEIDLKNKFKSCINLTLWSD